MIARLLCWPRKRRCEMGLLLNVYKAAGPDCTKGGVSSKANVLCVVNVPGPFEPKDDLPAVLLESEVEGCLRLVPAEKFNGKYVKKLGAAMAGGNYGATSDSRFGKACEELLGHKFYGA